MCNDWNVHNTSQLLDTLSARPLLGRHTTAVVVSVISESHFVEEHVPEILKSLPLVKCFSLLGLGQEWSWEQRCNTL